MVGSGAHCVRPWATRARDRLIAAEAHDNPRNRIRTDGEPAHGRRRRARRRWGHHRYLPALPGAGSGLLRAAARGGPRRRGHLVLESLPGRALRLGELHLRLPLLAGAVRGLGVAGALRRTARDRALPEPRGGPVRPPAPHALRRPRDVGRLRRAGRAVDGDRRHRHGHPGTPLRGRHRCPLHPVLPRRARPG